MDAKEAADAARKRLTDALPALDPAQLGLEEVVPGLAKRDWRVTFSFPSLEAQQGQQSAIAKRSYKELTISDADGSLICMTDRTPCAPKSCKIPCTARQCAQPGCTTPAPFSWKDSWFVLIRIFFLYPGTSVTSTSIVVVVLREISEDLPEGVGEISILLAVFVGIVVGLFAEGRRWQRGGRQRCGNKKKKRCSC